MKKQIITIMLITILLLQSCISNVFAVEDITPDFTNDGKEGEYTQEDFESLQESYNQLYKDNNNVSAETPISFLASVFAYIFSIIPGSTNALLSIAVMSDIPTYEYKFFTIESLLKGEFSLFDINIFDSSYRDSTINSILKENTAKWFYALRNFAIVALLAVLIYIGILMAISEMASDKAKYKKMLASWFVSFVLIFVIQYVLIIAINFSGALVKIISGVAENIENVTTQNTNESTYKVADKQGKQLERQIVHGYVNNQGENIPGILSGISQSDGWTRLEQVAVYSILVYYQAKFFFMYIKRMFMVCFLTAVSPLITITYSIDKAGDNQAQAYKNWFREIMIAIFIQPLHLLFFLIFIYSTQSIALRAPIFAILLIGTLSRAESIVRKIFKFNSKSLGVLGKGGGKNKK